ncbi:MAG: 4-hydroxy-3-methylbut-2-enyl diphosphate reductase [Clostridiales bacterium]|jgi:4-hydroxy-3-methylbut-2-enyl diphosphate reductase|nr:4-hydroxy-3-methylbut-2-enyl diphosphate reductase [Clostridiales bacterium]
MRGLEITTVKSIKSTEFCYGVKQAIKIALDTCANNENKKIFMYGPIVHNDDVIFNLQKKGIQCVNKIDKITKNDVLIIRAHGISKLEYNKIINIGATIVDATCPYVKKIHKIVSKEFKNMRKIIIIGNKKHSEVKGINGWCENSAEIIEHEHEIDDIFLKKIKNFNSDICIVSQTTFNKKYFEKIIYILMEKIKNIKYFDTICESSSTRQKESEDIAKNSDIVFVIGGNKSSNTNKLFEICKEFCENVFKIENAEETKKYKHLINKTSKVGITLGASTPDSSVKEVLFELSKIYDL